MSYGKQHGSGCISCREAGCLDCGKSNYTGKGLFSTEISTDGPNHIYYNINVFSPYNGTGSIPASFSETRTESIVDKPEDYQLAVARFSVDTSSIPITYIPSAASGYTNAWTGVTGSYPTVFGVELSYTGSSFSPTAFSGAVQLYYFPHSAESIITENNQTMLRIDSFENMLSMVNQAYFIAFNNMKSANPNTVGLIPPRIFYDPPTQLFHLNAGETSDGKTGWYGGPTESAHLNDPRILMSRNLYQFFRGFRDIYDNSTNTLAPANNYNDINLWIKDDGNTLTGVSYDIPQEFNSAVEWSTFNNLIFSTNNIPIRSEYLQTNQNNFGNYSNYLPQNGLGINFTKKILTDFQPVIGSLLDNGGVLQYFPQGPYRWIDLISSQPLRTFDVTASWQDSLGNFHPLYLQPGEQMNMKILFRRKTAPDTS